MKIKHSYSYDFLKSLTAFRVNDDLHLQRRLWVSNFYHTPILNDFFLSKTLLAKIMQTTDNLDIIVPESQKQNLKPGFYMVEYLL